jgi:hypothetical protein
VRSNGNPRRSLFTTNSFLERVYPALPLFGAMDVIPCSPEGSAIRKSVSYVFMRIDESFLKASNGASPRKPLTESVGFCPPAMR